MSGLTILAIYETQGDDRVREVLAALARDLRRRSDEAYAEASAFREAGDDMNATNYAARHATLCEVLGDYSALSRLGIFDRVTAVTFIDCGHTQEIEALPWTYREDQPPGLNIICKKCDHIRVVKEIVFGGRKLPMCPEHGRQHPCNVNLLQEA